MWKILDRTYWFKSPYGNLRQDRVELPNGVVLEHFYLMEFPDWAGTLCLTEAGEAILVAQYRHGAEQSSLEFPAGMVDAGETPLEAAQRELLEEAGYASDDWAALMVCYPEPNKQTNRAHLFVARNAKQVAAPQPEASEDLRVQSLSTAALYEAALQGEIIHGVYQAAIFKAKCLNYI